ncbi:MAG: dephospho-CoA kinase [Thermoplasmata archaeon]|nr:MAG: flagellar hook-basal body complex protein FliE [Thermoplasmata archaeon]RLF32639.1 MAG: dephospho-CoA kinase [Thermoplasmata archaeon]RLF35018.1 MAG: dephospho-CoA kinase [Thermoplasmata archaeon]RLF52342.1 MAG: dephospho-CoA kinase [Thermoplasmata archaeon]
MKIIAFTGMPFSGKSEAVEIAKDLGIPVVRMGDMVWDEVKKQGLEINDENVGFIANKMREIHGMDIWARRTVEKIISMKNVDKLVIDGVRNFEEIDFFKKMLGADFIVVAVNVSDEIRYKRAMARGREDDSLDLELVKKRDEREISWGLDKVINSADVVVSNEGSIDEFRKKIKDILVKI